MGGKNIARHAGRTAEAVVVSRSPTVGGVAAGGSAAVGGDLPPGGWPAPAAAYLHVPFCRHRCGYCNFSVIAGRDDLGEAFLEALESELQRLQSPRPVTSLFIGGGTPTHLPPSWIDRLLGLARRWFPLGDDGEFTVEANPGDIDVDRLSVLDSHGVNRLSLGVQSFDAAKLRQLQRDHTPQQAAIAIEQAAAVIPNLSIDLIFAAPSETPSRWQADLRRALQLPVRHLSTYALTYEKGTSFWNQLQKASLLPVAEDDELAMFQATREETAAAGMEHYEVSNFAYPGHRCRHNLAYWQGRGWYAAGPGAARFDRGHRQVNHRSATTYIRRCLAGRDPTAEDESISPTQWACERAAFGVRMLQGIDLETIRIETGIDLLQFRSEAISQCVAGGLLHQRGSHLRLSDAGLLLADSVAAALL